MYPTLEEKDVAVGIGCHGTEDEDSPAYTVTVPPDERIWETEQPVMDTQEGRADETGEEETDREEVVNSCPEVTQGLSSGKGRVAVLYRKVRCVWFCRPEGRRSCWGRLKNLKGAWKSLTGYEAEVVTGTEDSLTKGDIYLGFADSSLGLKEEGYFL